MNYDSVCYLQECLESLNATRKLLGFENLYANCDTYAISWYIAVEILSNAWLYLSKPFITESQKYD